MMLHSVRGMSRTRTFWRGPYGWLLLRKTRKTVAVSSAPPKEPASSFAVWRRASAPFALLTAVASFVILVYPLYVIRPFRYQGRTELAAALAILRIRPTVQIVLAAAALIATVLCWRRSRRVPARIVAVLAAAVTIGCGILSRVNVYELMFNPLGKPTFTSAAKTSLDGGEQVIGIKLAGTARAYPIRILSYHHMVNDVVAGIPVVATY
jgi:Protein of unknown function (DUF3179)